MKDGVDKGQYQNQLNTYTFRKGWEEMFQQPWPYAAQEAEAAKAAAVVRTEGRTETRLLEVDEMEKEIGSAVPPPRTNKNIDWPDLQFPANMVTSQMLNDYSSVYNAVSRNLRFVTITNGVGSYDTHILGTNANFAIVNRHVVRQLASGAPTSWTFTVHTSDVKSVHRVDAHGLAYLSGDLMLVMLPGLRFKDIRQYIAIDKIDFAIGVKGFICGESTTVYDAPNMEALNGDYKFMLTNIVRYDFINHAMGKCGNPLIVRIGSGWGIAAIHSAGTAADRRSYATLILRSQVDEACKTLDAQSGLSRVLSEGLFKCELEKPHPKNPMWYSFTPGIQWYGQIKGSQAMKGKSKIELSLIHEELPDLIGYSL